MATTPPIDPITGQPIQTSLTGQPVPARVSNRLPQSAQDAYHAAEIHLTDLHNTMHDAIGSIVDDGVAHLGDATQQAHSALAQLTGGMDLELDSSLRNVDGYVQKWANELDKQYNQAADDLYHSGVTMPYSVGQMQADMRLDPVSMVGARVPAVGQLLGGYVDHPTDGSISPPITPTNEPARLYFPSSPTGTPDAGTSPFTLPPLIPPTSPGPMNLVDPISYPASLPPTAPYTPTLPPILPPLTPPVTPPVALPPIASGEKECCCPEVTVNVPPINVTVPPFPPVSLSPSTLPPVTIPPIVIPPPVVELIDTPVMLPPPPAPPTAPPPPPDKTPELLKPQNLPVAGGDRAPALDWNRYDQCTTLSTFVSGLSGKGSGGVGFVNEDNFKRGTSVIEQAVIDATRYITSHEPSLNNAEGNAAVIKGFVDNLYSATIGSQLAGKVNDLVTPDQVRNRGAWLLYGGRLAAGNMLEQKTGIPMSYAMMGEQYALQWSNPQFLPDQRTIDASYLMGTIDSAAWECWTRANGNLPEPARVGMLASSVKPGVGELVQLKYRGLISDADYVDRMRRVGVLDQQHAREWEKLFTQLPTMTDLLRFMVRDSADESVAKLYGYDSGFEQKYVGKLQEWGKSQGIDPEIFKYFWRAHWEIPSNTALYAMFHRLRPDRPERQRWEKENPRNIGETEAEYRLRGPVSVTLDDVSQAMQVNDIAPAWVSRLLAVSYHPITRTDATRAYLIGAYSTAELRSALLDNGYSPTDADQLVRYYQLQKRSRIANTTGGWTVRKLATYYRRGLLSESEFTTRLRRLIDDETEIRIIVNQQNELAEADERAVKLKKIRRGFLVGEYSVFDIDTIASSVITDAEARARIVRQWTDERDGRFRQPSTEMVLSWMSKRLILADEALTRLKNMGYAERDAERMIEVAIMKGEAKGDLSSEEAGGIYEAAITTAKKARMETNTRLTSRLAELVRETARIRNEINRRNENAGQPALVPVTLP